MSMSMFAFGREVLFQVHWSSWQLSQNIERNQSKRHVSQTMSLEPFTICLGHPRIMTMTSAQLFQSIALTLDAVTKQRTEKTYDDDGVAFFGFVTSGSEFDWE